MEFTEQDAEKVLENTRYPVTAKNVNILMEEARQYILIKAYEEYAEERIVMEGDTEEE